MQQNQFIRHPREDPNEHLGKFLRMANIMKLNVVNPNMVKLRLFLFSLGDITASWFESLPYVSMRNWEELVEAYLSRFFPHALTFETIEFKQREDESLHNGWERYKQSLRRFPCMVLSRMTQMDIFYHAMNYTSKRTVDTSSRGAFRRKSVEEAT